MNFNSWRHLAFDKTEFKCIHLDQPKPTFTLKIANNIIAKTKTAFEYGNLLVPQFFLNAFDIPVAEYHLITLEIEQYSEIQVLQQTDLYFKQGHHFTKRNPTKDILVEYYDKSFENQVNRNILRFFGGLAGLIYTPGLTNEILLNDYFKLLKNVKYDTNMKTDFISGKDIQFQLPKNTSQDTGTLTVPGGLSIGGGVVRIGDYVSSVPKNTSQDTGTLTVTGGLSIGGGVVRIGDYVSSVPNGDKTINCNAIYKTKRD